MNSPTPIRVAIIGTGKRSAYLYAPLLKGLRDEVELVGVWGRSDKSARCLGEGLGVPWYTDIHKLVSETAPEIGIVSVAYAANGEIGLMAVESGLHVLLETPIAHKLSEADAIIAAAQARHLKIEVAEQFHRRPLEQIKLKLIRMGLFGRVYASFNDFAGHGYHGVSVMRSYLGFDAKPTRVTGSVHKYNLASHWARLSNSSGPRSETQEHGLIEFDGDQIGIYHWTSVGYDSPLRWWRSSRFLAEKGMGITIGGPDLNVEERLSLLAPGADAPGNSEGPHFITLERRLERVDGGALEMLVAHTGDPALPIVRWENPFLNKPRGQNPQW
ncbi:MAG: Gfo/Idh/MocA family oxidoreductase, partial [Anaerolineae bacterium]|nr:Gfo/Idh/MocA family oxidoreductase [Anaerolineae bacterium]